MWDRASTATSGRAYQPRGRGKSAGEDKKTTVAQTNLAAAEGSTEKETASDVVSLAFERYAKDRDRDRDGSNRVGQRSGQPTAPSAPFAVSRQPGDESESDGSLNANETDAYPSSVRHYGRQRDTDQTGTRSSKMSRDGSLENEAAVRRVVGVNSGDEGGGRSRRASFEPSASDEWRKWMKRGDTADLGDRERYRGSYGGDGDDDSRGGGKEYDGDAAISATERERALRGAFDMYDLNGDGFITYLEVGDDPKWTIY